MFNRVSAHDRRAYHSSCVVLLILMQKVVQVQAALDLMALGTDIAGSPVSPEKLSQCVDVILSYQNSCGGWATYENSRTTALMEVKPLPWLPSDCST